MIGRLIEAARADADSQFAWARREAARQGRHTALVAALALLAALAALGALIVGLAALYSWLALQLGPFWAYGALGGGLVALALILVVALAATRRPALAARPPLRVAQPAALLGAATADRKAALSEGADESARMVAEAMRGGSRGQILAALGVALAAGLVAGLRYGKGDAS